MHTYKKQHGNDMIPDSWDVGYYTMEANYNAMREGLAGGVWFAGAGGAQPAPPPVVSTWKMLSTHDSERSAIDRVHYLNGGSL